MLRGFIRWWWLLPVVAVVVLGGSLARARLGAWTRGRLAAERQQEIASLSEEEAALLVRRLPEIDAEASPIVAFALADRRPQVAAAAIAALAELLESWQGLPLDEHSMRAEQLASALASHAPSYSADALTAARNAATLLLNVPTNSRRIDAAALIADCESILRRGAETLAENSPVETRFGALPATSATGDRAR
jgi:hypothetical protein